MPLRAAGKKRRPSSIDMVPGVGVAREGPAKFVGVSASPLLASPLRAAGAGDGRMASSSPAPVEFCLSDLTLRELQLVQVGGASSSCLKCT